MKISELLESISADDFPWLDANAVKANKEKFIALLKSYAKNSAAEHNAYMRRGSGNASDWYKTRNTF